MGFDSEDVRFVMCFHGAVEVSSDGFHKDIRRFDASDKENCYIGQKYLVNPELRWDLQVRAAHAFMPSFIAVWLGASVNTIVTEDHAQSKLRIIKSVFLFRTLTLKQL